MTLAALQVRGGGQASTFTYHPNIAAGFFLVGAFGMLGAAAGLRLSSGARARALQALWFVAFVASLAGPAFTGSRSGVIEFLAGVVVLVPFLVAWAWQRLRGWSMLAFLGVAGGLVALAYFGLFPAAPGANLVVNSGFEAGTYPWKLGGGSARASTAEPLALDGEASSEASIETADGAWLLHLTHDAPGWQELLTGGEPFFVDAAGPYTVSLYTRPSGGGVGGTFLRVEARDEYGAFVARAGRGGWTTGDEGTAGAGIYPSHRPLRRETLALRHRRARGNGSSWSSSRYQKALLNSV